MAKFSKETDYYAILGVSEHASEAAIKKAYHLRALAFHSDKFPPGAHRQAAEEEMKRVNEAYAILSKPELRKQYDAARHGTQSRGESFGSSGESGAPGHSRGPESFRSSEASGQPGHSHGSSHSGGRGVPPPLDAESGWPELPLAPKSNLKWSRLSNGDPQNPGESTAEFNSESSYAVSWDIGKMENIARRFVSVFNKLQIPGSLYRSSAVQANASQCAFEVFNGPLYGTDVYVRIRVIFKKIGTSLNVSIDHKLVLFSPFLNRVKHFGLRVAAAALWLCGATRAAYMPLNKLTGDGILFGSLVVLQIVDKQIVNPRLHGRFWKDIPMFYWGLFWLGLPALLTGSRTDASNFMMIGVIMTGGAFLMTSFGSLASTDMWPGQKPWSHDNLGIKDAVIQAVFSTVGRRV